MFVVRPVQATDIDALASLAQSAAQEVHTLPRTLRTIERAVERSVASFAAHGETAGDESYVFALEDASQPALVGTAAIQATAGSTGTFFAFRNDVIHQVSRDLNISHNVHALTLCSDLTGYSQLSTFYIQGRQAQREAILLSRARLLFAAVAPHRFSDRFFASMAGVTDANGRSPFWEALGRKFFQMDFLEAERLIEGARNRTLIVELMPHYPIYVPLLPGDAQAAMGQVHPEGELPFQILSAEGFEADEYIDLFDGGPLLQARRNALRAFSASMRRRVSTAESGGAGERATYIVCNLREEDFRAVAVDCPVIEASESIALSAEAQRALDVAGGDTVLCVKW